MKLTFITIFITAISLSCNPVARFGVLNPPNYAKMDWSHMDVKYEIKVDDDRTINRQFKVADERIIREGFSKLRGARTRRAYFPSSFGDIRVRTNDQEEWNIHIVFEDRFDFGLSEDSRYTYTVSPNNYEFFKWLEALCLDAAKSEFPEATSRNIILRKNLSLKCYESLQQ